MDILRDGILIKSVKIDKSTTFTQQLMGEHKVEAVFILPSPFEFTLGDYIELGAEKFYMNTAPELTKINNFTYRYQVTFEGEIYKLFNKIFMDEGSAEFTYFGDLEDFLLLLLTNINSIQSGWTINVDSGGERKFITFNQESCRQALNRICEEFWVEYRTAQKEIIVGLDVGFESIYEFEYGRGKGLYQLNRTSVTEKGIVTRLYAFGGEKNLSFDYREGARRLVFEQGGKRYIEANTELYGIKEGVVTYNEIFPNRTGSVTSSSDKNRFIDTSIDFNLNEFLLEGTVAKVVFKSGALSGYEFEIRSFNNGTKEVVLNDFLDSNDYVLPNELNKPEPGDEYTFVDIRMPQVYIDAAENNLLEAAQEYLDKHKSPQVTYRLNIDERFIRQNGVELACGMYVGIKDSALGLDENIRIYSISYPVVNPKEITAQIADTIPFTVSERIIKETVSQGGQINVVDRTRAENYRDAVRRVRQLTDRLYDPDGKIRPENISIDTLQLNVGTISQNFGLNGVLIEPNFGGNPNHFRISAGQLIHFEIEIEELGYVWEMDQRVWNDLDPDKFYYVYARCNKSALSGTWVISEDPIMTNDEPGFYHFWLGILYEVVNGSRYFMFTKGITTIVGDTIKTGKIQSLDGLNFFDLTQGKFKIGNSEASIDWGVTAAGQLTLNGVLVTKMIFAENAEIINLLVSSLRTAVNGKRIEIKESSNNIEFYDEENNLVLVIDDDIDSGNASNPLAGIRVNNPVNGDAVYMSGNGLFSNSSGVLFLPPSSGIETNASVVGLLRRRNSALNGISAAVAGIDQTTEGNSESYGAYFNTIKALGVHFNAKQVTGNYTCTDIDYLISCYNNSNITINLPPNPKNGRIILIRRNNNATITVNGNGKQILLEGPVNNASLSASNGRGRCVVCHYDGQYWLWNYMPL